jgi:CheY-like chemotaxis protein/DNA-directed RNA polymerase subunit RPC12/RpoP
VLGAAAEEARGEIGVAGAVHGARGTYVILARRVRFTTPGATAMKCPRCQTPIGPLKDPDGVTTCPGCGSRLMTRSAALRSHGGKPAGAEPAPAVPPASSAPPAAVEPAHTVRPASASYTVRLPPPGLGTKPTAPPPAVGTDTSRRRKDAKGKADVEAALDLVLQEVRAVRETQQRILRAIAELRRTSSAAPVGDGEAASAADEPTVSPIRDGRGKTVMLIDDDPSTREEAVAELQRAEVPVRAFDDGNAALSAIAEEKPDVIALEIGLGGAMGGKDLVNLIKATMEWVDIPIVLWTREAVATQKEARQIHGADEVVPKSSGPAALLACVINAFRR